MKEKNIQRQKELMLDLYKNNLEDIINSNIDNRLPSRNNDLQLLKLSASTF